MKNFSHLKFIHLEFQAQKPSKSSTIIFKYHWRYFHDNFKTFDGKKMSVHRLWQFVCDLVCTRRSKISQVSSNKFEWTIFWYISLRVTITNTTDCYLFGINEPSIVEQIMNRKITSINLYLIKYFSKILIKIIQRS